MSRHWFMERVYRWDDVIIETRHSFGVFLIMGFSSQDSDYKLENVTVEALNWKGDITSSSYPVTFLYSMSFSI